jgi:hypothetical protein
LKCEFEENWKGKSWNWREIKQIFTEGLGRVLCKNRIETTFQAAEERKANGFSSIYDPHG